MTCGIVELSLGSSANRISAARSRTHPGITSVPDSFFIAMSTVVEPEANRCSSLAIARTSGSSLVTSGDAAVRLPSGGVSPTKQASVKTRSTRRSLSVSIGETSSTGVNTDRTRAPAYLSSSSFVRRCNALPASGVDRAR